MSRSYLRTIRKISLTVFTISILVFLVISDIFDRGQYYSVAPGEGDFKAFYMNKTTEERQNAFERNFGNEKYNFPRENVAKVKLFRNTLLVSRLTATTLSESSKTEIVSFFNNPAHFDWSETTWDVTDAEYILRFYNSRGHQIGQIWLCTDDCGMTHSIPFSPNMKYGGLSEPGTERLKRILNKILTE